MVSWIYEIVNKTNNQSVYIGSTTGKYFCLRKCDHIKPSTINRSRNMNNKLYIYIRENGGWENMNFNIIIEYNEIEKNELLILEKQYILEKNPIGNTNTPIRTVEEIKEKNRLKQQQYRITHPEYNEKCKTYESRKKYVKNRCSTIINCDCGNSYTLQNKTNHLKTKKHQSFISTDL